MWAYVESHPVLFIVMVGIFLLLLWMPLVLMIRDISIARIRHRTIRMRGYPPAHCDIDGEPYVDELEDDEKYKGSSSP